VSSVDYASEKIRACCLVHRCDCERNDLLSKNQLLLLIIQCSLLYCCWMNVWFVWSLYLSRDLWYGCFSITVLSLCFCTCSHNSVAVVC